MTGSARDLSLLVRNLIDNAVRYTRPGGRVDVGVEEAPDGVVLAVCDTGVGIPTRDLPRVFERFYRVDRARSRETGGTGLGLAIVKHVAENHGGSVAVESELGVGTTFTVRLPGPATRRRRRELTTDDDPVPGPARADRADRQDALRPDPWHRLLDDRGRAQAEHLAERSRSRASRPRSTRARSSDACRRWSRSRAVCRLPIVEREGLIEMHAGSWTGKPLSRLRRTKAWAEVQRSPATFRFPGGGEGFAEARDRAVAEVDAIARRHRRGRVVVATHGDILRDPLAHLAGAPLDDFQRIVVDTASVSVVDDRARRDDRGCCS